MRAMKRRHLVRYDYGQGALWTFVLAESPTEITSRHPELTIVDEPPTWLSGAQLEGLETIDLDRLDGTWLGAPPGEAGSA
jgi:hypothetical protein